MAGAVPGFFKTFNQSTIFWMNIAGQVFNDASAKRLGNPEFIPIPRFTRCNSWSEFTIGGCKFDKLFNIVFTKSGVNPSNVPVLLINNLALAAALGGAGCTTGGGATGTTGAGIGAGAI